MQIVVEHVCLPCTGGVRTRDMRKELYGFTSVHGKHPNAQTRH
ncbi:hypothetical protein [Desulfovibrio sp.]|nr:hypothetical protein [Desulfovibrio sp.]